MIKWTKELLDGVAHAYRTSKTPSEGLAKARLLNPNLTYNAIRRAFLRHDRPSIQDILGKSVTTEELIAKYNFQPRPAWSDYRRSNSIPRKEIFPEGGSLNYKLERILIIPDCHHPYVDKKAWELVLKVGRQLKPERIIILGDFADYYSISKYIKKPGRISSFKEENELVNNAADQVETIGSDVDFIAGNHENRLISHILENSPALYGFTSIEQALRIKERGWRYTPYGEHVKVGKCYFTHDTEESGKNAHQKSGASYEHSIVIGHVHSLHVSFFGNAAGESHVCASMGWLGDAKYADYMKTIKKRKNWHLGFGWAALEPNGNIHLSAVPIVEYKCFVEGKLFEV